MFQSNEGPKLGLLMLLTMGTGCSLIYDGDVFAKADAGSVIDPSALALDSIEPSEIFEGLGASDGARAIPIVIHGTNIAAGAHIEIMGGGLDLDVVAETSVDGTMAATAIRVPVDTTLSEGASLPVTITIRQDAGVAESLTFDVLGLAEFAASAGTLSVADIAPRYSRISIHETMSIIGNEPARFVATDSIDISNGLHADGRADGQRSAGGFLGGLAEQNGGGGSGGTRGTNTGGGGGGGGSADGGDGQGAGAGPGGTPVDAPFAFPLVDAVGHGGGGGGGAALQAGAGGAGGGAIELRANGPITLAAGAILSADGADGGSTSNCTLEGGGGGGGSGGAILIRSATQLVIETGVLTSVEGGAGGSSSALGSCKGGDGSSGRLRADAPEAQGSLGAVQHGPSWVLSSVPVIVSEAQLQASLAGDIGATYFVTVNSEDARPLTLTAPTESLSLTLTPGLNQVCALVDLDGNQGQPESLNCLSIAYLP